MNKFEELETRFAKMYDELEERIQKLEWLQENPPKFKYGDVIILSDERGDGVIIKTTLTVKDNGTLKTDNVFYFSGRREYTCDNGTGLIVLDEITLLNFKKNEIRK